MAKTMQPFHEMVAAKLIAQLEQGCAPWQKPWEPGPPGAKLPMNPVTGKRYRGINAIHLISQGHTDPRWMTYRQAASIGAQVNKGEKGTPIQYWQFSQERVSTDALGAPVLDAQGRPVSEVIPLERPKGFLATVFHASQIDGLPPLQPRAEPEWPSLDRPERILRASGATIRHAAYSRAYYRPATDTIALPDKAQFPSAAHYYATALHELGHWTGHVSRLNRDLAHPFGSEGYAREELRAEIASMILGDALGIGHDPAQHAAYVGSWIHALRRDPLEIFRAAADAEKIQGFVLGLEQALVLQQASGQTQPAEVEQRHPIGQPVAEAGMQADDHLADRFAREPAERLLSPDKVSRSDAGTAPDSDASKDASPPSLCAPADVQGGIDADAKSQSVRQPEQAARSVQRGARTFIAVPYPQHEQAKALGARWDRHRQSWYVPAHVDPAPFDKWKPVGVDPAPHAREAAHAADVAMRNQVPASERTYLAVPYEERQLAKAAGAAWDKAAKSWYAGPRADRAKLDRWRLENVAHQQAPAMRPREEFAAALRAHGLVVSGEHPIMDGKKHRIPVQGGKRGALDGFYVGHLDGHPAGRVINYKTGADITWHSKGYVLSREQTAAFVAQARATQQARDAAQAQRQEHTAQRIGRQIVELMPLSQATPYLQRKGVAPQPGVLTDREGRITVIPGTDADGKPWTMQTIDENGTKRFAKDSRKEGCFHVVGGLPALAQAPALVISEGYATAASVSQALGFATVAAFDAGNLVQVARALQARFPDKPVIIAGDDDRHLELTHGENRGRVKAQEAAAAIGGHLLLPVFAPGEGSFPAGLAPVTPETYREHLRTGSVLTGAQLAALEQMKRHTDFNDLGTTSILGKQAIERQVRAFVARVVGKHAVRIDQPAQQFQRVNQVRMLPSRRRPGAQLR